MNKIVMPAAGLLLFSSGFFLGSQGNRQSLPDTDPTSLTGGAVQVKQSAKNSQPESAHSSAENLALYSSDDFSKRLREIDVDRQHSKLLKLPQLFAAWAENDPEAALLATRDLSQGAELAEMVFGIWAENDPLAASRFYTAHQGEYFKANFIEPWKQTSPSSEIAAKLAGSDLNGALKWAEKLARPSDGKLALKAIFGKLASDDPQAALSQANELGEEKRLLALTAVAKEWAAQDSDSVIEWINELGIEDRDQILPSVLAGVAAENPEGASTLYEYLDEAHQDSALDEIASIWRKKSPEKTADWLLKNSTEEQQSSILHHTVQYWAGEDQQAALSWIEKQESGQSKDIALTAYIRATAFSQERPQDLLALSKNTIKNEALRDQAMVTALFAWSKQDQNSATTYAESSLSDDALAEYHLRINANSDL